ncbi:MAG TPA: lipid-binding SYLF domain-containing protein [Thermoanaerobaculia bacterium]|nr:lipid-binding SYLF domain-containing protein [Thermoanaerobaculia bacterium]
MRKFTGIQLVLALVLLLSSSAAWAKATKAEAQKEVAGAGQTLDNFAADPDMNWFREHAKEAKGLFVCHQIVKAGFIIGGSGGRCVLVVKGEKGWQGPAFYTIGTASAGFQAGIQDSELIGLVMTQKAIDSLMSNAFKAGGDASVAAGPVGVGTAATPNADIVFYSRSKGLYGGVDISGASIKPSEDYNKAYYGKAVSPIDIIVRGSVHPSPAPELMTKATKLYGK